MRTKRRSRSAARATAAAAMAAALLSVSCWLPLFDPEVSASEKLAKRLGDPIAAFTVDYIQKWNAEDSWFVPERVDVSVLGSWYGILFHPIDSRLVATILTWYDDYGTFVSAAESENNLGSRPFIVMAADGYDSAAGICRDRYSLNIAMATQVFDFNISHSNVERFLGAGSVASSSVNEDRVSCCCIYSVSGDLEYMTLTGYQNGQLNFTPSGANILSFPALGYVTEPGTFLDMGTYLFLSCGLSDGSRAVFRWTAASMGDDPVRYPEVYGALLAGLSDGRLLAFDGITTTVLSPDMKKLFSFPSGKLRFVHERYDATLGPICVFTRTFFNRDSNGDDWGSARIEVYEIPTSRLGELGS